MIPKVKKCFEAGAHVTGCQLKIQESRMFYDVNFNETLCLIYQKHMERLGAQFPDRNTQEKISRGSTDMGNVTYEVPGREPYLISIPLIRKGSILSLISELPRTFIPSPSVTRLRPKKHTSVQLESQKVWGWQLLRQL